MLRPHNYLHARVGGGGEIEKNGCGIVRAWKGIMDYGRLLLEHKGVGYVSMCYHVRGYVSMCVVNYGYMLVYANIRAVLWFMI